MIEIKYDGYVYISVCSSRKTPSLARKHIKWSNLLTRFSKTKRTFETVLEYKAFDKVRQDEIKDVGGFVGGILWNGKRDINSLRGRTIITLDIDFGDEEFLECVRKLDFAYCIYSTHKHKIAGSRYRLVIPINEKLSNDDYIIISKAIAKEIGIKYFDKTTFQPARLMYWPSTCKDGEYYFYYEDKPWINLDKYYTSIPLMNNNKDIESEKNNERIESNSRNGYKGNNKKNQRYENNKISESNNINKELDNSNNQCNKKLKERINETINNQYNDNINSYEIPKKGIIGAFCRIYNVYDVIEKFLNKVYLKTNYGDRFTYYDSSTIGGFVVYNNGEYGYSYHESDPTSGRICNSYDLLRIHKFLKEGFSKEDEKSSYSQMRAFIMKDEKLRVELNKEKLRSAQNDFEFLKSNTNSKVKDNKDIGNNRIDNIDLSNKQIENIDVSDNNEDNNCKWVMELAIDPNGKYKNSLKNISTILANDENLKGKIAFNEFAKFTSIKEDLPWHKVENKYDGDMWQDSDDAFLRLYLEDIYEISAPNKIADGVAIIEKENKFHPIRDYLNSLTWDGINRLETLFIDYLGAEDTSFVRSVTVKSLVAAVARVFNPGVKFDYILVLSGQQGIGKSQIIERLGKRWYSDSITTVQGKEAYEQIQNVWIIEMAELAAIKKSETESIKHFISKSEDIFRMAYGKRTSKFPRQCVFFGTTNNEEFLKDKTGNRRFWPVRLKSDLIKRDIWKELNEYEIDNIWAEALIRYKAGEKLYLDKKNEELAKIIQENYTISDYKEGIIYEFLEKPIPESWNKMSIEQKQAFIHNSEFDDDITNRVLREKICALEVWVELFRGDPKMFNLTISKEITDILSEAKGWNSYEKGNKRLRFGSNYGIQKAFVREKVEYIDEIEI